jgi:hypothetical protein
MRNGIGFMAQPPLNKILEGKVFLGKYSPKEVKKRKMSR